MPPIQPEIPNFFHYFFQLKTESDMVSPYIASTDHYWHEIFKRLDENPVDIHVFAKRNAAVLRSAYHEIIGLRVR